MLTAEEVKTETRLKRFLVDLYVRSEVNLEWTIENTVTALNKKRAEFGKKC